MKGQKGFTLIELMIVVAVIGVLSAIAIPMYKDYVKKSEVAAGIATLKPLMTEAELVYQQNGSLSAGADTLTTLGISAAANPLGTISIKTGNVIEFAFDTNKSAVSGALSLTRDETKGWSCSNTTSISVKGC
ncbi:pilin [Photobacterium damselae]|uniref:pilin n=1 Tax=Photobacterium damselae TaxID=38293 RepID=UPI0010FED564|nr:prepilin-type N-terminal cleavage/methylation domain-containing protein [Photobacterium damselae]TLS75921.1 pilin [Photobacterium damselae subsp. damselae]TLS89398.1 pilin [Photobacterium damselae subsp. damselae]